MVISFSRYATKKASVSSHRAARGNEQAGFHGSPGLMVRQQLQFIAAVKIQQPTSRETAIAQRV